MRIRCEGHERGLSWRYVGSLGPARTAIARIVWNRQFTTTNWIMRSDAAAPPGTLRKRMDCCDGTQAGDPTRNECEVLLSALFETTYRQLSERQSEFEPLLPDDGDSTAIRVAALAHWCEGFLHGLVSSQHGEALKERLSAEPLSDIIKDMLQITRACVEDEIDSQTDEESYAELVEYLRVAAQLTYEELVEFRQPPGSDDEAVTEPEVLH